MIRTVVIRAIGRMATMVVVGSLLSGVGEAAEVPPKKPDETVVVTADRIEARAFAALIKEFEAKGWRLHRMRSDGFAVFKHSDEWKGAVMVGPQGSIEVRRPVVHDLRAGFGLVVVFVSGQMLPSKQKLRGPRRRVLEGVEGALRDYQQALTAASETAREHQLLGALKALWERGTPLVGDGPPLDHAGRRAAALDYWATRTETAAGRNSQAVVSRWFMEVVQRSERPLTPEEIRDAEARRSDGARVLDDGAASW